MTMSENEVVMALSQKVATLERRLEVVAKLHLGISNKLEELSRGIALQDATLRDVADRCESFQADD